jgi:hypothetical protein
MSPAQTHSVQSRSLYFDKGNDHFDLYDVREENFKVYIYISMKRIMVINLFPSFFFFLFSKIKILINNSKHNIYKTLKNNFHTF